VRRAAAAGPLLETFVVNELEKQLGWSKASASLFHFRDRSGIEVDAILETRDGRVAAVEVKAGTRVDAVDMRGPGALARSARRPLRPRGGPLHGYHPAGTRRPAERTADARALARSFARHFHVMRAPRVTSDAWR